MDKIKKSKPQELDLDNIDIDSNEFLLKYIIVMALIMILFIALEYFS